MPTAHPDRIRLGVSACLLGQAVRYDGGHKRDSFLTDVLDAYVEWTSSETSAPTNAPSSSR